jgi:hypothetical protein
MSWQTKDSYGQKCDRDSVESIFVGLTEGKRTDDGVRSSTFWWWIWKISFLRCSRKDHTSVGSLLLYSTSNQFLMSSFFNSESTKITANFILNFVMLTYQVVIIISFQNNSTAIFNHDSLQNIHGQNCLTKYFLSNTLWSLTSTNHKMTCMTKNWWYIYKYSSSLIKGQLSEFLIIFQRPSSYRVILYAESGFGSRAPVISVI